MTSPLPEPPTPPPPPVRPAPDEFPPEAERGRSPIASPAEQETLREFYRNREEGEAYPTIDMGSREEAVAIEQDLPIQPPIEQPTPEPSPEPTTAVSEPDSPVTDLDLDSPEENTNG